MDETISCLTIVTVLNIYGRSSLHSQRSVFFSELLRIPPLMDTLTNTTGSPTLIMGDFNYSYEKHRLSDGSLTSAPMSWTSILDTQFVDCFKDQKHPTWSLGTNSSILDFIFCDATSHFKVDDLEQSHINSHWTDHDLLSISFQYSDSTRRGPGAWKANPLLAKSKTFRSSLAQHLAQQQSAFDTIQSTSTPQHT